MSTVRVPMAKSRQLEFAKSAFHLTGQEESDSFTNGVAGGSKGGTGERRIGA